MKTIYFIMILIVSYCFLCLSIMPKPKQDECRSLKMENKILREEISKWKNHSIRMKRIVGISDTVPFSYIEKIKNPIITKNIFKKHI